MSAQLCWCEVGDIRTAAPRFQELLFFKEHFSELVYLFPDFDGVIKSLGAWGGDFVMVISNENPTDYFMEKGYETVIPYEEMIL